jgi:hypothetical protein
MPLTPKPREGLLGPSLPLHIHLARVLQDLVLVLADRARNLPPKLSGELLRDLREAGLIQLAVEPGDGLKKGFLFKSQ